MNAHQILTQARELIADPTRWTTGDFARHKNGNAIGPLETNACQWCSLGAVQRIVHLNDGAVYSTVRDALYDAAEKIQDDASVVEVNDSLGHAAALRMFDIAIEATKPA